MHRVLILALDNWLGASCLPRAFKRAGFEVSLLCYPNTLISLTKYVDDQALCMPEEPGEVVARKLMRLIEANPPRLMIPADDSALWYMRRVLEVAPAGRVPQQLVDLVRDSLPDATAFKYGEDKEAASQLMNELGFRTPPRAPVADLAELKRFSEVIGFPILIKPLDGLAGDGVQIFNSEAELQSASISAERKWMAQKYIVGKPAGSASVALKGKWLGTVAYEKTLTHPGETGQATVITRLDDEEILRGAAAFAKATNFTGFYSPGYMIERDTGDAYFIEVNTRPVPTVPAACKIGLDLCGALHAKLSGAPLPKQDLDAPRVLALYPQELLRDPHSPYRKDILDEPVDDPALHKAMQQGIEFQTGVRVTR